MRSIHHAGAVSKHIRTSAPARNPAPPIYLKQDRRLSPFLIKLIFLSSLFIAPWIPVAALLAVYGAFLGYGWIAPNVQAAGTPIGGLTVYQAAVEINKDWNLAQRITASDGVRSWVLASSQLGISIDALKTAQNAYRIGRGQDLIGGFGEMLESQRSGREIPVELSFDPESAQAGLQAFAAQVNIPPVNASLSIDGESLTATPGVQGYNLDIERTLQSIAADPRAVLTARRLTLALAPVAPRLRDVSAVKAQAEALLSQPFSLQAYDPISDEHLSWPVPKEVIASWMRINTTNDAVTLSIDETQAAQYAAGLAGSLGPERWIDFGENSPSMAQSLQEGKAPTWIVKHQATTYIVEEGDTLLKIGWKVGMPYWRIAQANPDLDQNAMREGQKITIPSKDDLLPLPVIADKRIVISISEQHMWTYQDEKQLNDYVISTGIDRSPTQPGIFQVQTHELSAYAALWDLTMPHFLGIYEAWPGFMNGIHGLPTLSNGQQLWASILGRPASYGCIILNTGPAEDVFNWAENGVVVEIRP